MYLIYFFFLANCYFSNFKTISQKPGGQQQWDLQFNIIWIGLTLLKQLLILFHLFDLKPLKNADLKIFSKFVIIQEKMKITAYFYFSGHVCVWK